MLCKATTFLACSAPCPFVLDIACGMQVYLDFCFIFILTKQLSFQ